MCTIEQYQNVTRYLFKLASAIAMGSMLYYLVLSFQIYNLMHSKSAFHKMEDLPTFTTICIVPVITAFCLHGFKL